MIYKVFFARCCAGAVSTWELRILDLRKFTSYIQYVLGTCTRHIHCAVIPEMNSELQGAQICMDKAEKRSLLVGPGRGRYVQRKGRSVRAGKCPGEGWYLNRVEGIVGGKLVVEEIWEDFLKKWYK